MCAVLCRCLAGDELCADMLICAEMDSRHSDGSSGVDIEVRSDNPSGARETDFDIPDPMN